MNTISNSNKIVFWNFVLTYFYIKYHFQMCDSWMYVNQNSKYENIYMQKDIKNSFENLLCSRGSCCQIKWYQSCRHQRSFVYKTVLFTKTNEPAFDLELETFVRHSNKIKNLVKTLIMKNVVNNWKNLKCCF